MRNSLYSRAPTESDGHITEYVAMGIQFDVPPGGHGGARATPSARETSAGHECQLEAALHPGLHYPARHSSGVALIGEHPHPVHPDIANAYGELMRVFERCPVAYGRRVEDHDIGTESL